MLLSGKGLIVGVANKHSIAWAIAQSARPGAQLFFNYQNDRLKENVEELVATSQAHEFPCDAGDDAQIDSLMNRWKGSRQARFPDSFHCFCAA